MQKKASNLSILASTTAAAAPAAGFFNFDVSVQAATDQIDQDTHHVPETRHDIVEQVDAHHVADDRLHDGFSISDHRRRQSRIARGAEEYGEIQQGAANDGAQEGGPKGSRRRRQEIHEGITNFIVDQIGDQEEDKAVETVQVGHVQDGVLRIQRQTFDQRQVERLEYDAQESVQVGHAVEREVVETRNYGSDRDQCHRHDDSSTRLRLFQ